MPRYDLHCHSTYSDGLLPPAAVVARAAAARRRCPGADRPRRSSAAWPRRRRPRASAGIDVRLRLPSFRSAGRDTRSTSSRCASIPTIAALIAGLAAIRGGRDARARRIARGAGGGRHRRRVRRRDALRDQRASSSRARISRGSWSRRATPRTRKDVFKRYLTPGQARLRRARMGDAAAGDRLDPCGRRPGGDRASGPLSRHARPACAGCSREFRDAGGDGDRSPVAVAHAGAVRGIRDARARVRACAAPCGSD